MRPRFNFVCTAFLTICAVSASARADFPTTQPYSDVRFTEARRSDPPMHLLVVQIDLTDPNVTLRVSPAGPDPDGAGEWQTVLMPPSKIADREGFDICINASFFGARSTKDVEGEKSGFVSGVWSKAVGYAMTDGKLWSKEPNKNWPVFWIDGRGRAHLSANNSVPEGAKQMVQGNAFVLRNGQPIDPQGMMKVRHPRTVVGLDKDGKTLTILTVDGRRPKTSVGMTGPELGDEMQRLGCDNALNLDGGGSTELVMRDPETGKLQVMNNPSDSRERAVADVIGVHIRGVKRVKA
jgi:exopolysaccharide biosynthesis protein